MKTLIKNGLLLDPANNINEQYDLLINDDVIDLIDKESGLIRADKIDEISTQIADEFDMLLSLKDFNENWKFWSQEMR